MTHKISIGSRLSVLFFPALTFLSGGCGTEVGISGLSDTISERISTRNASVEECVGGGLSLSTYIDKNKNGALDPGEEILDSHVICSGVNGASGANGADGINGLNGMDGQNGADGKDGATGANGYSLVYGIQQEAPSCANGGYTLSFGLDVNRNNTLDSDDEQVQSIEICHGDSAPATATESCEARVVPSSEWDQGYVVDVYVKHNGRGNEALSAWTVEFELPEGHVITNAWNTRISVSLENKVTAKNADHNGKVESGKELTFGMQVQRSDKNMVSASSFKLNGVKCK